MLLFVVVLVLVFVQHIVLAFVFVQPINLVFCFCSTYCFCFCCCCCSPITCCFFGGGVVFAFACLSFCFASDTPKKPFSLQFQRFFFPFSLPKAPFIKIVLFYVLLCPSGQFLLVNFPSSSSGFSSLSSSVFLMFSPFLLSSSLFPLFIANSFSNNYYYSVLANLSLCVAFCFLMFLLFCSGFAGHLTWP